ncbi:hypothetical protein KY284_011241 [Solanum tuberosum]|nr:hypothetical protein KY284_011241 [Solanum tuberosum]
MEHAKSNVRGTHEHVYAVLNAYRYMLEVENPGSKTALSLDENKRFKYLFISFAAWIIGFQEMRKVIVVDGTFLRSNYERVLLSVVAQDAENHIFLCCGQGIHLEENIRNNFHNSKVVTHFYKAAKTNNRCEFNDHFNQIKYLVPKAAETLERIGFHTWSRAFFLGNRYNIMTSNIAKSRRMELVNSANRFVPSIEKDISKYLNAGNKLLAHQITNYKFSVTGHSDVATWIYKEELVLIYEYSSPYYLVEKYIMAYCEEIHPIPPEDSWIVPLDIIENEIPPHMLIEANLDDGDIRDAVELVTLVNFPYRRWLIVQEAISFLEMCRTSGNLEALYRKGVFDFFNRNDPTSLRMINQAADGGHIGASYVLVIISIFNGGESMREGGMWVPEPHLLGGRPICCTVHQFDQIDHRNGSPMGSDNEDDICCELCSCDLELDYVVKFLPYTTVWLIISTIEIQMNWECLIKQQTEVTLVHPMCLS